MQLCWSQEFNFATDRWFFQQCFTPEDKGQDNKSLCAAKGITSLSYSQTELLNWARYLPFPDNKSFFFSFIFML